jgi:hypothetical protein
MREERAIWEAQHPELAARPGSEPIYTPRQSITEWQA